MFIGEILGVFGILIVFRDNEDIFLFIEDFMRFEMFVVMVGEEIFKFELLVGIFFFCFWILCKLLSWFFLVVVVNKKLVFSDF